MNSNLLDKIRLLFKDEKKPFLQLKAILGFYPHNIRLYDLALMHKSVARFGKDEKKHVNAYVNNERLEYLGDAILGAVVADVLYKHYGNKQEGFLTNLRSKIVCRSSLNKLAQDIGLDKLIKHNGAVTTGHNSFMYGNAFEAFFGAIYLDRGYEYCYRFMEDQVFKKHINIEQVARQEGNFKSALIEWCQKRRFTFEFKQKEMREGNGHSGVPVFHSKILVEGIPCGTGDGYTKKESDQNAAKQALSRLKRDKAFVQSIRNAKEKSAQQVE
ncbi:MAG: ribonuclease III [Prevotellaceae bacterium]|nr:ribonuclease III [Candidatus Minthosoma equi]